MTQENYIQIKISKGLKKFKKEFKEKYGEYNLYKSNNCKHPIFLTKFSCCLEQKTFILSDSCISIKNVSNDYFYVLKEIVNYFETESFFAILFLEQHSNLPYIILIKKEDIEIEQKEKLINIVKNLCIDTEKEIKCILSIITVIIFGILLLILLVIAEIKISYLIIGEPQTFIEDSIKTKKVLVLGQDSPYWEVGLRPYDIPISINGISTKYISKNKLEEMLKGKNVRLKVFKRETGECIEYKLNTD